LKIFTFTPIETEPHLPSLFPSEVFSHISIFLQIHRKQSIMVKIGTDNLLQLFGLPEVTNELLDDRPASEQDPKPALDAVTANLLGCFRDFLGVLQAERLRGQATTDELLSYLDTLENRMHQLQPTIKSARTKLEARERFEENPVDEPEANDLEETETRNVENDRACSEISWVHEGASGLTSLVKIVDGKAKLAVRGGTSTYNIILGVRKHYEDYELVALTNIINASIRERNTPRLFRAGCAVVTAIENIQYGLLGVITGKYKDAELLIKKKSWWLQSVCDSAQVLFPRFPVCLVGGTRHDTSATANDGMSLQHELAAKFLASNPKIGDILILDPIDLDDRDHDLILDFASHTEAKTIINQGVIWNGESRQCQPIELPLYSRISKAPPAEETSRQHRAGPRGHKRRATTDISRVAKRSAKTTARHR
jgi:hypothetical protein